jgi:hypothetical protein
MEHRVEKNCCITLCFCLLVPNSSFSRSALCAGRYARSERALSQIKLITRSENTVKIFAYVD